MIAQIASDLEANEQTHLAAAATTEARFAQNTLPRGETETRFGTIHEHFPNFQRFRMATVVQCSLRHQN